MSDINYDIEKIEANIKRHDDNIKTFEEAIVNEMEMKAELRRILAELKANPPK